MSVQKFAATLCTLILALALVSTAGAAQSPEVQPAAQPASVQITPPGSVITYQGYLTDGGLPANGIYDFFFGLYGDSDGSAVWIFDAKPVDDLPVENGFFTARVDFTDALYGDIHFLFNGEARWLRVSVRPGASTGGYTALSPLQALTPAPYAQALPGLHTVQNETSPNVVGGFPWNSVNVYAVGGTISGGGSAEGANAVNQSYGTVGGGYHNVAGGGYATVAGGSDNTAGGLAGTVAGGELNTASGEYSAVPGGASNSASANYTLAAGRRAKAIHEGSFVWADATDSDFSSTAANRFMVRAKNGAEIVADNPIVGLNVVNNNTAENGDGLRVWANTSLGTHWGAVFAHNSGTSPAVYGSSAGTYAGYFADSIYVAGSCVGCRLVYLARNDGAEPLEEGDLVVASGVTSLAGSESPVLLVRRAGTTGDALAAQQAIAGVVLARGELQTSKPKETAEGRAFPGERTQDVQQTGGPAAPGDYLFLVVQGVARVKVDASAGAITAGQRLAGASIAGHSRALRTVTLEGVVMAEGVATLGIALEPLEAGTGLISVLVNLQ